MLSTPVEYASQRKIRTRNKLYYRINHWPIWIFVFFIAPGPLTFALFERGFNPRIVAWLTVVVVGTAIAGLMGRLPGTEAKPLIVRFIEDCPNPIHRRICYTIAWSELVTFTALNVIGLVTAVATETVGPEADYQVRRTSRGDGRLAGGGARLPAPGQTVYAGGRVRAALLLRLRLGGGAVHPVLWMIWKVRPKPSCATR